MSYIPPGGNIADVPEEIATKSKYSHMYHRLDTDAICPTITNVRKTLMISSKENECISVSEASALMGFDKSFEFYGSLGEKYQQISNGVARFTGRHIAKTIKKRIQEVYAKPVFI